MADTESNVELAGMSPAPLPRWPLLVVTMLAILTGFAFQGSRGLYESTEGRYAECARQSMEQGTLDEPVLNGENHWTKPPLTYYVIAAGLKVFGNNAWGARIGQSFAFVLTVLAVYYLGFLVWGPQAAFYCAVVYGLSPFPAAAAHSLSTDTLLTLFETLTLLAFWLAVRRKRWYYMVLMWAVFSFAFMTKGFPALLCLIGPAIVFFYLRRQGEKVPQFFNPLGIALFLLIGFSWYAEKAWTHPGLMQNWIMKEGIARNVSDEARRNAEWYKPFTIYLPLALFGTAPWVLMILAKHKQIPWPKGLWRRVTAWQHPVEWLFIVTTFTIPFLVFCLVSSRLPLYLLPLFAPLALAVGKGLEWLVSNRHLRLRSIMLTAVAVTALVVVGKGLFFLDIPALASSKDMGILARDAGPILEKYPNSDLYVLKQEALLGLQFYLHTTPIVRAELENAPEVLKRAKTEGKHQLVFVRRKKLEVFAEQIDQRVYKVEPINDAWSLIVITPPEAGAPSP
jgi:4-amino-4-deoxy-L-arabinose transferase